MSRQAIGAGGGGKNGALDLPPARGRPIVAVMTRFRARRNDVTGGMAAAEKTQRYEAFVSDVLQRDLRRVQEQRDAVLEQQAQVLQLRSALSRLQDADAPLHTQVDLGCNFFVSAEVPDPRRVFVALGFGFFAELTLPEALRHLERRHSLLQRLSDSLTRDGAKIRAHIRLVLEGLRELQGLQEPPEP